jgi:hypothetical protein
MSDYAIFGGCLRSELPFPELRAASGSAVTWTLRTTPTVAPLSAAECLGELEVTPACRVRLYKHEGGYRLAYDDTGTYDVSRDGREIVWCPGPSPHPGAVRADIVGRVLATALHAAGTFCLHGSAVALHGGSVAFVAPKYHGKSTLAVALARAGGRLVTDDVLPVEFEPGGSPHPSHPPRAVPGAHHVKLWTDSAELFGVEQREVEPGEKHVVHDLPDELLMLERSPLVAIYLLSVAEPEAMGELAARRERLDGVSSALALVRHAAIGPLLGGSEAAALFERAVAVARAVPVYRLTRVRGLDRLDDVVSTLLEWHAGAAASRRTVGVRSAAPAAS